MPTFTDAELIYLELTAKHAPHELGTEAHARLILRLLEAHNSKSDQAEEIEALQDEVDDLEDEVHHLENEVSDLQDEVEELQEKVEELEAELDSRD